MLASPCDVDDEEHHMPCIEAMLAYTLVLMTGYCQSLQAAQHPIRRMHLATKIDASLAQLARDPRLSEGFRAALANLHERWLLMRECTAAGSPEAARQVAMAMPAPEQLQ
jgi:hypothetical protein